MYSFEDLLVVVAPTLDSLWATGVALSYNGSLETMDGLHCMGGRTNKDGFSTGSV